MKSSKQTFEEAVSNADELAVALGILAEGAASPEKTREAVEDLAANAKALAAGLREIVESK